jgi:hypothetical protein
LDGKLSEALVTAEKLRVLASERMDTKLMLQAQKEIGRLLAMQQRANGKVPREVSITEHARIDIAKAHWSVSFPEGTEQEFVDRFGMKERTDLPDTAPRIVWKVNWLDAEIQNPESLLPITATPSEVEEAENRKEEQ